MNPSSVMLTLTGDPKSAKSFLKVRRKKSAHGFPWAVLLPVCL